MAADEPNHRMDFHEATITPVRKMMESPDTISRLSRARGPRIACMRRLNPPLTRSIRRFQREFEVISSRQFAGKGSRSFSAWKILSKSNSEAHMQRSPPQCLRVRSTYERSKDMKKEQYGGSEDRRYQHRYEMLTAH
jgi:hypothetical protein